MTEASSAALMTLERLEQRVAWGLRNLGGKLASAVLNSTTRKGESTLPTNSGFRAVSGASLKG